MRKRYVTLFSAAENFIFYKGGRNNALYHGKKCGYDSKLVSFHNREYPYLKQELLEGVSGKADIITREEVNG